MAKIRGGTCTIAKSDPPDIVIHRATYLLNHGFGNYDAFKKNCEDFALYCKTGLVSVGDSAFGGSGQVACAVSGPMGYILTTPLRSLMSKTPVGMVVAMAGLYSLTKYAADIGVRKDVVKVRVEDLMDVGMNSNNREDNVDGNESEDGRLQPYKRPRR